MRPATRSAIIRCRAPAAASSAAPAPSTAWSISAATGAITRAGSRRAPTAGAMTRSCPISRNRRIISAARRTYHGAGGELDVQDQRDPNPVGTDRHRGRDPTPISPHRRFQRRRAGRVRLLAGDAEARRPRLDRARLPRPGARPPQPHHRHRRLDRAHRSRRQARGRHHGAAQGWRTRRSSRRSAR